MHPAMRSASSTFSRAEKSGSRAKDWKTKPMLWRRSSVSRDSPALEISSPSRYTLPLSGRSRPAMRLSSVVLPEPERPRSATNSPL